MTKTTETFVRLPTGPLLATAEEMTRHVLAEFTSPEVLELCQFTLVLARSLDALNEELHEK